ncbi:catalase, partial [Providencia rettgeri]|nr:catalase [Providencia rettgeri]
EQAAFTPANLVPGIGHSPDRMLQGRIFSYGDTQRYRLGVNHGLLPVNAPRCPFHSYHRDGAMRTGDNTGGTLNYEPNSQGEWQQAPRSEPPLALDGQPADHWDHRVDDDYYSQPGNLFRLFNDEEKQRLFSNIADAMAGVPTEIIERQLGHFTQADPAYGAGVRAELSRRGQL